MCSEHIEQKNSAEKRKIALPVAKHSRERTHEHTAKTKMTVSRASARLNGVRTTKKACGCVLHAQDEDPPPLGLIPDPQGALQPGGSAGGTHRRKGAEKPVQAIGSARSPCRAQKPSRRLSMPRHQRGSNEPLGAPWLWLQLHCASSPDLLTGN